MVSVPTGRAAHARCSVFWYCRCTSAGRGARSSRSAPLRRGRSTASCTRSCSASFSSGHATTWRYDLASCERHATWNPLGWPSPGSTLVLPGAPEHPLPPARAPAAAPPSARRAQQSAVSAELRTDAAVPCARGGGRWDPHPHLAAAGTGRHSGRMYCRPVDLCSSPAARPPASGSKGRSCTRA